MPNELGPKWTYFVVYGMGRLAEGKKASHSCTILSSGATTFLGRVGAAGGVIGRDFVLYHIQ